MLRTIYLLIVLLACGLHVAGQGLVDTPSAHLLQRIQNSKADTGRVKFLLALSKRLILKSGADKPQIDSAYALEKQAEALSLKANDLKNLGKSTLMAAMIENKKGDRNKGLLLSQRALAYFKSIKDLKDEAETAIIIGQHYGLSESNISTTINNYKVAVALFRQVNEKERLATTLVDLADYQQWNDQPAESQKNLREALKIYKDIGYKGLTNVYNLMGQNLLVQGDKEDALKYLLLAERSALALKDTTLQLSALYNRLSECYSWLRNYNKAISYSAGGVAIANRYRDSSHIYVHTLALADLYRLKNEPLRSIAYLNKIKGWVYPTMVEDSVIYNSLYVKNYINLKKYALAKTHVDKLPPFSTSGRLETNILETHLIYLLGTKQYKACYPYLKLNKRVTDSTRVLLAAAYNELNWFKADSALGKYYDAMRHYQLSRKLSDSSFSHAKDKQAALLQIDYETEQKEQHLALQAKNIELLKNSAQLEKQKQRVSVGVLTGVLAITMIVLVFGYSRYRLKQRNNLILEAKQLEIRRANVSLQSLVTEKEWLLKEVHHRVKNNLQIIMSLLSSQSAYLENIAAIEAIRESQNRVQAISLIHQKLYKSNNVASINMPAYVADLLEYLADSFGTRKRHIRFEHVIEPFNLDLAQAVPVGLILNEAITNAIKYAFEETGGQIIVGLQLISDEKLLLTIADNGGGFPLGMNLQDSATLGMEMMKALSKQLGGEFKIENSGGVRIGIEFLIEKGLTDLSKKSVIAN
nr:sensor histidine kinase [Mucilaginibacter sp. L294]